ncbi:9483_t:CDS:10 [Entrophospora sp. SA101]|nr:9483_t:CDS:10 [Entrophospora sp. SA101]
MEFAEWICKTHHQPCHVVYTDFRPTPLQHYIYIDHLNEICLLVDEKGTFYENAFQKKIREPFNTEPKNSDNTKLRRNNVHSMIKACISSNLDPIIAFAFSNKECNNLAIQLNKMDFNNGKTKVVDNAMDLLAEEDRQLKSIHDLLSLLKCGIGIYHSELLPFLKEVSTSGEYIQMSGHAGRRGIDDRGHVIMSLGSKYHLTKDMVKGKPNSLLSAFHLRYHMILNMSIIEELKKYKKKLKEHKIENEESVAQYYSFVKLKEEMTGEFNVYITSPKHCMRFLTPGRLVWVKYDDMDFGWNMVIKCEEIIRRAVTHYNLINSGKAIHKVKVLLHCSNDSFVNSERVDVKPCPVSLNDGVMLVVPIKLKDIQTISQIRLHAGENIEHERHLMHLAYETINDILSKHPTGVPLDPIKMRLIEENINKHPINQDPLIIEKYTKRLNLVEQIESVLQFDEFKKRRRLLRRMGYLSENNMVELKGRIACGIKSGDEIVLTELLLNDVFNKFIEPYNQILETARIVAEITEECAIAIDKEKYMAKFSPGLVESVYAWCNHVTFPETCKKGKMQGDIARNFENLDELLQEMNEK